MKYIDSLLKSSDFFYKIAGLMEFPPIMRTNIMTIIQGNYQSYMKWVSVNGEKSFPAKGLKHSTTINVNLEGLPERYKPQILLRDNSAPIKLMVLIVKADLLSDNTNILNSWSPANREFLFTLVIHNNTYERDYMEDIVEHELTHMIQTFISNSIKLHKGLNIKPPILKNKPGYPSQWRPKKIHEPLTKEYREYGSKYLASGIEFFPQLRQNINEALRGGHTKYDFTRFVLFNKFMSNLKDENPSLYERAVSETWKAFQNVLDTNPDKEQDAKIKLEISKSMNKNRGSIISYANKMVSNSPEQVAVINIVDVPNFIVELINLILKSGGGEGLPVSHVILGKTDNRISFSIAVNNKKVLLFNLKDDTKEKNTAYLKQQFVQWDKDKSLDLLNQSKAKIIDYANSIGFEKARSIFEAPPYLMEIIKTLTSLYKKPMADFFLFRKNKDQSVSTFIISEGAAEPYVLFTIRKDK